RASSQPPPRLGLPAAAPPPPPAPPILRCRRCHRFRVHMGTLSRPPEWCRLAPARLRHIIRGDLMGSVVIDERTIHYHAVGDPSRLKGRRLLYVHGTGCTGEVWLPHMKAIGDTHTAVAIDLPGHGQSSGRGFRGVGDYTHFAVELARALHWDRFVIVGHSLGGAIALLTAPYHADRLDGL